MKSANEIQTNATKLITYSDACGGQNRNIYVVHMLLHILSDQYPFTSISHKFMIPGHSHLPNDCDFRQIEMSKKRTHIYVPDDWEKVVVGACHKNTLHVRRMKQEVPLKDLKKTIVNRKVNTHGEKVEWLKIQWICVCKERSLQFQYRYSHTTVEA